MVSVPVSGLPRLLVVVGSSPILVDYVFLPLLTVFIRKTYREDPTCKIFWNFFLNDIAEIKYKNGTGTGSPTDTIRKIRSPYTREEWTEARARDGK